jgi:hypothetical protein
MEFINKWRESVRFYQIWMAFVALLCFVLLAVLLTSSLLLYRTLSPAASGSSLNPESLLGRTSVVQFSPLGGTREGWFFPGLRGAPTIILLHGYKSRKEEVLTLAITFQEHQYNVFLFDFSGHGDSGGSTRLGGRETEELLAAVQAISQRDDVDKERFGVWGQSLGGYVALASASREPKIRALAVDSIYNVPSDMLKLQIENSALNILSLSSLVCRAVFYVMNFGDRNVPPLEEQAAAMSKTPKLFIVGNDDRALAQSTLQVFNKAAAPKEQAVVSKSRYGFMLEDEKRAYDNTVVQFFLQNLPPVQLPPSN